MSSIKHETSSQVIRCNDEHTTLQLCKPSVMNDFTGSIRSQMSLSFLLINGVIAVMRLAHSHKDCVSEHEHGESHRRCRNARNGNHQLLFSHGQVRLSLARRTKSHTIIKPHEDGSEDALQHTYDLVVSFQKARTRWRIKATGFNALNPVAFRLETVGC